VNSDEAVLDYASTLTQLQSGWRFIEEELQLPRPKVAWIMDSFGNSKVTPTLLSNQGFDYMFIGRLWRNWKKQLTE
jgi:hypothetical protein